MRPAAVVLLLVLAPAALAQAPPVPAVPEAATAATAAAGAAPAKNLFSFFCLTPEQKAKCRAHFCTSPAGQLVNNLLKPAAGVTGGLVGPVCPGPNAANPENLKKDADSVQGATARIQAEEAEAGGKIKDLGYLAQKNCKRYPEAEAALINGLRAEKNECVRLAAAQGLARGCCCTAKVVKALTVAVTGSTADSFAAEDSPRVKLAAFVALERCLANCAPAEPPPEVPGKPPEVLPVTYYTTVFPKLKPEDVFADARRALAAGLTVPPSALPRPRGLFDALTAAPTPAPPPTPAPAAMPPARQPRTLFGAVQRAWGN